jgi:hypothetical protein
MGAVRRIGVEERRARLALRHRLAEPARTKDPVAIARALVGLHSSDPASVYLSTAARMRRPALGPLGDALYEARTLVRYHAMRRTLWVSPPAVARWAHAACTVGLIAGERRRLVGLIESSGVAADGERWLEAARRETLAALEDRPPMTARQLGDLVPALRVPLHMAEGKPYAASVAAHTRVLLLLGFEGVIVRATPTGSWVNSQYRWAHTEAWLGEPITGGDARDGAAKLADAWLRAFGPATEEDLRWWAGWTAATTRRALADAGAVRVDVDDGAAYVAAGDEDPVGSGKPWVALLPGLDPATMGWKARAWYLPPEHTGLLFDRNGNGGPTVWVDGRIVGGWVQRKDGTIALRVVEDVGRSATAAIERAAGAIEKLLGDARVTVRFPAPLQAELLR